MAFRPAVYDTITINRKTYKFMEHPSAKGMPYGQTGRRATAYQLQDSQNQSLALKVFSKSFRTHLTEDSAKRIEKFAHIPGLQVCSRTVITPTANPTLLKKYPELEYAVLMPWVPGQTWQEIMLTRQPLTLKKSLILARNLAGILAEMEAAGIAHCDLSGPNVLVDGTEVALVDLEDLCAPGLDKPEKLPGGSAGYGHQTANKGLWGVQADRFAGAILISEMLGWHDERVRRFAAGEQYFDQGELHSSCDRYKVLLAILDSQSSTLSGLFMKIWQSKSLDDCPRLSQWVDALNSMNQTVKVPASSNRGQVDSWTTNGPVTGYRRLGGVQNLKSNQQTANPPNQQHQKIVMPDIIHQTEAAPGAGQIPNPPSSAPWQKKNKQNKVTNYSPQGVNHTPSNLTENDGNGKVMGVISIASGGLLLFLTLSIWMDTFSIIILGILAIVTGFIAGENEHPKLGVIGAITGLLGLIIGFM